MLNPGYRIKLPRLEAETDKRMKIGQNLVDKNRPIFGLFGNGIWGYFQGSCASSRWIVGLGLIGGRIIQGCIIPYDTVLYHRQVMTPRIIGIISIQYVK